MALQQQCDSATLIKFIFNNNNKLFYFILCHFNYLILLVSVEKNKQNRTGF